MLPNSPLIETHDLAAPSLNDVCIIETDMTRETFDAGHIPGTIFWPMGHLLTPQYQLKTDPEAFAILLESLGITPDTLVVCSFSGGPQMAGWAPWLYWIFTSFGHEKTVVLNGGALKWRAEGRPLTTIESQREPAKYSFTSAFDADQRAVQSQVLKVIAGSRATLLDARTDAEYKGQHFFDAPPKADQKAGRIPGALHLPHTALIREDGTFRCSDELKAVTAALGLSPEKPCITYCTVGIRSSLLWFALKELLGFSGVRNYDGSWNQWSRIEAV